MTEQDNNTAINKSNTKDIQAVKYHQFGDPAEVLKVEKQLNVRPPKQGEVLVRMNARPINPSDLIPITGAYAHRIDVPAVPGYEGIGVVEEVGAGVSKSLLGRRVLPLRGEGTWQTYVRTKAAYAVPVPNEIEDQVAAQLYINPLTAWVTSTDILALCPGDTLLINASHSSLGRLYLQLSQLLGFHVIAVTRHSRERQTLFQLGAQHVINASDTSLYPTVMSLTGGTGVDAAIDMVGGRSGTVLASCVRPSGTYLSLGLLSGTPVKWSQLAQQEIQVQLFHLRHWNAQVSDVTWRGTFQRLFTLMMEQKLQLINPRIAYPLTEVKKAVQDAQLNGRGKVLLT
ncbi:zinc-dependent alcohol dehydrogenase family protein [Caldalkalibacillus salinus]|uniref:zinc-dependent alcohol dehydrogenase family protein n=1 Tax=Caldalkalibacillus salinus TaxID=2803787 RepID=UPI001921E8EC|nr:zinc-dependent alcohol dehydrogenase family protein [Caldalkalibacillus salinus]